MKYERGDTFNRHDLRVMRFVLEVRASSLIVLDRSWNGNEKYRCPRISQMDQWIAVSVPGLCTQMRLNRAATVAHGSPQRVNDESAEAETGKTN